VVLKDKALSHFPRQVFYPTARKQAAKSANIRQTVGKKTRSKSPSGPHAAAKKPTHKSDSSKRPSKVPKTAAIPKPVSSASSKSAEKATSAEMMRYLEDIPKILQAREERKTALPEAVKAGLRKEKEERERRILEEVQLKGEIQKRKQEIARNNMKIREINKNRAHKRSFPSENAPSTDPRYKLDHKRESSEARKRPNHRTDRTPPSAKKARSLSEEQHGHPEELAEYMERRKIVMKEGKQMAQLCRKAEEGNRLSQLKELDKMQRERLVDYKRGKKKENAGMKGKKRAKKPQKRTKSSEVLPWDGSPGFDQHSSSPNLLKEDEQEFSLYQRELDLRDNQPEKRPPFFFADFIHSPKPQQFAGFQGESEEAAVLLPGKKDHRPETATADFPARSEDSAGKKMEIRRKLADLRIKSEGGNREEAELRSAVWLVRSVELKQMIREEAAIKIQSHVRRYLTQKRLEDIMSSLQGNEAQEDGSLSAPHERVSSEVTAQATQSSSRLTVQQFEERLRLEQDLIAKAAEDKIASLRDQNRKLAEDQKKSAAQISEDDYLLMLQTTKQQEMQQFQELLQTKCGSRVDLVEEMSMAFENMLEARFRQFVLLFSQNREKIQAALKSTPSEMDISSTFAHVSDLRKEETRPFEEERGAVETSNPQDTSLDAFLRKALGTEEATKIEAEAANQAAEILTEAKRQADSEYSHFDPYADRPQNPFPEHSDEDSSEAFISPDLSAIQIAQESFEDESLVPVKRRSRPSDPDKLLQIQLVESEDAGKPIWHIASPEPDDGVRSGTEQFPYRVVGIVTRGTDEPMRPVIPPQPASLLDSSSSEGLEDLLSRPLYQQPKAPLKPSAPKPRPSPSNPAPPASTQPQVFDEVYQSLVHQVITESLTTAVAYPQSVATGMDTNPFEDTSSAEREAMRHEDSQAIINPPPEGQINDIVEALLRRLILESFPKPKVLPELPRLNFQHIDSVSQPESLRQQSERLERFGPAHISDYIALVFSTISETRLKSVLETPIVLDPTLVLGLMQDIEQGPLISIDMHRYPILPIDVYLQLDDCKEVSSRSEMTPSTKDIIRDSKRYHNRLLFDAANELLQRYRPYGLKGAPLPWSKSTRALNPAPPSVSDLQAQVCTQLIDWSSFEVGKIPEVPLAASTGQVNEQHLQMIREEKLSRLLTKEIVENDQMWIDYEAEDAQVKIDLADMILEQLMDEIEAFLQGLR
jgi:hypothetical protein